MGGVCSAGKFDMKSKPRENDRGLSGKLKSKKSFGKQQEISYPSSKLNSNSPGKTELTNESNLTPLHISSEFSPSVSPETGSSKVTQRSSFLGRAGVKGFGRAVDILDTLGSSMSNLKPGSGFNSGMTSKGNKVSILAFEVANTIGKGAALFQSLSEENLNFLKKEILFSKGVRELVSTDMKELLSIAASDKREELDVFSREVIRFGNWCRDRQWHNLGRYFSRVESGDSNFKQLRDEAEMRMQELVTLAQYTSELYHEMQALDRFEQDYKRKLDEANALNLPQKGESFTILCNELKQQRKLMRSLKKKSLWSSNLEEIVEKFVDVVAYIHQAIVEAFGNNESKVHSKNHEASPERLGKAGLALHYANIIQQIDSIASRPSCLPANVRDMLYNALPANVKKSLRSRLKIRDATNELSVSEIKTEMEETLHWLVPLAKNTTKAHQGFGWVGEWGNSGIEFGKDVAPGNNVTRFETLYHADKEKMDSYILEVVVWLHHLISSVRNRDPGMNHLPSQSPTNRGFTIPISKTQLSLSPNYYCTDTETRNTRLSLEDRFLLEKVYRRKLNPWLSKSQEFDVLKKKKGTKVWALSRSQGSSPTQDLFGRKTPQHQNSNSLDVLDGLNLSF